MITVVLTDRFLQNPKMEQQQKLEDKDDDDGFNDDDGNLVGVKKR